ncbi:MAG: class I SAM-dependent methyltransferase [Betaproteobacteria bacterium]|nr:class I SAM-dependent methyltransferase [Betaproteobacteria bacterium]
MHEVIRRFAGRAFACNLNEDELAPFVQVSLDHLKAHGDFVTAAEISPFFGQTLANSVREALRHTHTQAVYEFGAGNGSLALHLLDALGDDVHRYTIIDISGSLRQSQAQRLQAHAAKVNWLDTWPTQLLGVVVGNEVLDAMPVRLLHRVAGQWHERGVVWDEHAQTLAWQDRPTHDTPPLAIEGSHDYLTEIHPQAEAFVRSVGERLQAGAMFFIDYGFPEHEYYHPQRHMGTLMCHQGHLSDGDPLQQVGHKDITAHVNFTSLAWAAQEVGLQVLGYASQAQFLLNSGLLTLLEKASVIEQSRAQILIQDHEMGELFKVMALGRGEAWVPMGFVQADRTHRL